MNEPATYDLLDLAQRLGCRLEHDPAAITPSAFITSIAALSEAGERDLSFLTDMRMLAAAAQTRAGALLVGESFEAASLPRRLPLLRAANPELALAQAIALLRPPWRLSGIHPSASIDPTAELGAEVAVGAFAVVGAGCRVGARTAIHPHAVLYPGVSVGVGCTLHAHVVVREGTHMGDEVVLQPGVVVGGDGFGFARGPAGALVKIPQAGGVRLGDRVEVQANSCIDRATLGETRVGDGTKIDNLVQVAHNCELGADILLCAQVGLAGSTRIEDGAILAGQAGVAGHCTVGKGTVITAQSGTHGDLEAGKIYSGSPAFDHGQWLRSTAAFARLGEMQRELRRLRLAAERKELERKG